MSGGEGRALRFVLLTIILIVSTLCFSCSRLYTLSVKEYPTDWGSSAWILDYSLDGKAYSVVFDTREELVIYYAWLKRGRIEDGGKVE